MRKLVVLIFLVGVTGYSQNKQVLYDFASLPQTLLLNPGAEVDYKFHIGLPLLSQLSVQAGFTGFSVYDIFADDGIDINDKIRNAVNNYGTTEFMAFNQQLEVLSGGFRLKNDSYLSFGYYQELDFLAKIPRDIVDLFYDGNTDIDRRYYINKLASRAELFGVLHIGLSKKINKKFQLGARFKIYSSVFNANTKLNTGSFYTQDGNNNTYTQHLENVNFLMQTSGVFFDNYDDVDSDYVKSKFLFGGDLGLGLDLGFTYHPKKQWIATGSVLDLGFIKYTKNIESYRIKGNYEVEGFQLLFDPNNPQNYWNDLKEEFDKSIVLDTLYKSYITLRPVKLNGSISYSFGQQYDDCRFLINPKIYLNKVGFQLYSNISAVHSYIAATLFYERRLGKHLQTKVTYTADPYSFSNIGMGLSTQLGIFNAYFVVDNLLSLRNLYNAKSTSFQLGVNFIIKHNN
ncbi:DUF5723 family protein [uncultured Lutibacter sp.]|uniref:DUF5723 family protein n=1 Tax=uncultured Lutibacter sp. TaxID=437739 RepID=UPI00262EFA9E|nr:DUF5723 family protein [uncultured Lutibacter sp.]